MPGKALRLSLTGFEGTGRVRLTCVSAASPSCAVGYFSRAKPREVSQQSSLAPALRSRVHASSAAADETANRVRLRMRAVRILLKHTVRHNVPRALPSPSTLGYFAGAE